MSEKEKKKDILYFSDEYMNIRIKQRKDFNEWKDSWKRSLNIH